MVENPSYTPEVKRAVDTIRRAIEQLSLSELVALRDALSEDWPINPLAGVREPRNPLPSDLSGSVELEEPRERPKRTESFADRLRQRLKDEL